MEYEGLCRKLLALLGAFALLTTNTVQADTLTELKVKAAYLYNFTKFVKWPAKSFGSARDPLTICTFGEQPFAGIVAETVSGKTVDDHPLAARQVKADGDVKGCQVLFVSETEAAQHLNLLSTAKSENVLLVSEVQSARTGPGNAMMITFVLDSNRVRFRINNTAAEKAGLTISARLLSLAMSVQ